tara:strand:- start:10943 stop:11407 length:465 start_codon:yes stop_codon:yes gene_type:complete
MNLKVLNIFLFFVLTFQASLSQEGNQELEKKYYFTKSKGDVTLDIEIINLKSNKGFIHISIQDKNKDQVAAAVFLKINNRKSSISFDSLTIGSYAIQFYHDENKNRKLDVNLIGIPKESFGSSNDVKPVFAPPKFEKMLFDLNENLKITMKPVN